MSGHLARGGVGLRSLIVSRGLGPDAGGASAVSFACMSVVIAATTIVFGVAVGPTTEIASSADPIKLYAVLAPSTTIVGDASPKTDIRWEIECMAINVGDTARVRIEFRVDGTLTDPSSLSATVTDPTAAEASYSYPSAQLAKISTGIYDLLIDCTSAGNWRWRIVSPGPTAKGAERGVFVVEP